MRNYVDDKDDKIDKTISSIQEGQIELRMHVDDKIDKTTSSIQEGQIELRNYVDDKIEGIGQRIFWTVTVGVAFLTIALGFVTYILKVPVP